MLVDFPQRQHEEFSQLVHSAVEDAARAQNIRLEDYIQQIYYRGEIPSAFNKPHLLKKIYHQYQELIEDAVSSVDDAATMSDSNKAYLCYRIYLHGMTIERKIMSEDDAKQHLIGALREFFYSKGKLLSLKDELKLIKALSLASDQARPL